MMKKLLMAIAMVALGTTAFAEDTDVSSLSNALQVQNVRVSKGKTAKITVNVKSAETNVQSIGAYVTLPAGITATGASLGAIVPEKGDAEYADIIDQNTDEDGATRVALLGCTGKALTATEGQAFRLHVAIDEDVVSGKYPVTLTNVELCTTDSKAINLTQEIESTITVSKYADVNVDDVINITDVYDVIDSTGSIDASYDLNDDDTINITDIYEVIDNIGK